MIDKEILNKITLTDINFNIDVEIDKYFKQDNHYKIKNQKLELLSEIYEELMFLKELESFISAASKTKTVSDMYNCTIYLFIDNKILLLELIKEYKRL